MKKFIECKKYSGRGKIVAASDKPLISVSATTGIISQHAAKLLNVKAGDVIITFTEHGEFWIGKIPFDSNMNGHTIRKSGKQLLFYTHQIYLAGCKVGVYELDQPPMYFNNTDWYKLKFIRK